MAVATDSSIDLEIAFPLLGTSASPHRKHAAPSHLTQTTPTDCKAQSPSVLPYPRAFSNTSTKSQAPSRSSSEESEHSKHSLQPVFWQPAQHRYNRVSASVGAACRSLGPAVGGAHCALAQEPAPFHASITAHSKRHLPDLKCIWFTFSLLTFSLTDLSRMKLPNDSHCPSEPN